MIKINRQPLTDLLKRKIYEGFRRHAIAHTGHDEKQDPVAFIAMEEDLFAGAIVVEKFWGALHIKYIYVDDSFRGKGIGADLMNTALKYGIENDCPFAFVETMSFQALGFYQKLGFVLEFTRTGYAHNTSFHYLQKKLC